MIRHVLPPFITMPLLCLSMTSCQSVLTDGGYRFSSRTEADLRIPMGAIVDISLTKEVTAVYPIPVSGFAVYAPQFGKDLFVTEDEAISVIQQREFKDSDVSWIYDGIVSNNFRSLTFSSSHEYLAHFQRNRNSLWRLKSVGKSARVITTTLTVLDANLIKAASLGSHGRLGELGLRIPIAGERGVPHSQLIRYEDMRVIGFRYAKPIWSKDQRLISFEEDMEWTYCDPIQFPKPQFRPAMSK